MSSDSAHWTDLTARVRGLEEQVAALHEAVHGDSAEGLEQAGSARAANRFWALRELKARTGDAGAVLFTGAVGGANGESVEWQQDASAESLLETDWSLHAEALAALGQPLRLTLLRAVVRGAHSVAELSSVAGLGTSGQLYHHLRQLVAAGWLRTAGRGRYEVPAARVIPLLVVMAATQR